MSNPAPRRIPPAPRRIPRCMHSFSAHLLFCVLGGLLDTLLSPKCFGCPHGRWVAWRRQASPSLCLIILELPPSRQTTANRGTTAHPQRTIRTQWRAICSSYLELAVDILQCATEPIGAFFLQDELCAIYFASTSHLLPNNHSIYFKVSPTLAGACCFLLLLPVNVKSYGVTPDHTRHSSRC